MDEFEHQIEFSFCGKKSGGSLSPLRRLRRSSTDCASVPPTTSGVGLWRASVISKLVASSQVVDAEFDDSLQTTLSLFDEPRARRAADDNGVLY
jgi:hypothetical protein